MLIKAKIIDLIPQGKYVGKYSFRSIPLGLELFLVMALSGILSLVSGRFWLGGALEES